MSKARVATKFACDAGFEVVDALARVRYPGALHGPVEGRADEIYLDTRTDALAAAGLCARVREHGGVRTVALVVVPIDPDVLPRTPILERAVPRGDDVGDMVRAWVRERFGLQLTEPPREVLSLVIARRRWAYAGADGPVDIVVDDIAASEPHGRRAQLIELTIEHDGGGAKVVAALRRAAGVGEPKRPLFARARETLGLGEHRYGSKPAPLQPDELLVDGARRVLGAWWANALAHAPGVRVGLDPEHVHKMRVALRRLRTALRLFDDAFDAQALASLRDGVRTLGRALGEVRDLDVQHDSLSRWRKRFRTIPAAAWADIADRIDRRRTAARRRALAQLEGAALARFDADVELCVAPDDRGLRHTVGAVAASLIHKRVHRCTRALDRVTEGGADEAHALRIDVKNLRYSLDFLGDALPGGIHGISSRLAALQEELGKVQDDVQTAELAGLLATMAPPPASSSAHALGVLVGYGRARAELAPMIALGAVRDHDFVSALAALEAMATGDGNAERPRSRRR